MNKNDRWLREHLTRKGEPKKSYSTYASAKKALDKIENKDELHIYLCSICQKYHIGHLTMAQRLVKAEEELNVLRSYNVNSLVKELEETKKERDHLKKNPTTPGEREEIKNLTKKVKGLTRMRDELLFRLGRYENIEPINFGGPETRKIRVGSIVQLANGTCQEVRAYNQYRIQYVDLFGKIIDVPLDKFRRIKY